ncbi:hypothetical protein [Pseudoalteromonas luteoviolacea]|uniref:Uncharacterized protein n=1 Tax=Pseudoalteromonas luteoviolacea (strain 2ta16) TaxID=1353533 RepID=V4HTN2_PSEL2|nr:hypothetical protein [Pseudoalteromonas luteoviolacea]ESP94195.1 hypothetical protein PL2TA16_02332 [Pseudoalteromonas luteoviolacea 2ta16]KZN32884.1 hypothetical protein N483_26870 [Pseudoalteromonas luteoviolacea NCIMB 1944]
MMERDYEALLRSMLDVEGKSYVVYLDHKGIPTMGVGFNLQEKDIVKKIINQMGYTPDSIGIDNHRKLIDEIVDIAEENWTEANLSSKIESIESQLATYKGQVQDQAIKDSLRDSFEFNNLTEMTPIFEGLIREYETNTIHEIQREYNAKHKTNLTTDDIQEVWNGLSERQKGGILSMVYNGGADGMIGKGISTALVDGDVAGVFWEIAFNSLAPNDLNGDGVIAERLWSEQKRRADEAHEFIEDVLKTAISFNDLTYLTYLKISFRILKLFMRACMISRMRLTKTVIA